MKEPQQLGFGFDEMLEEQRTAYLPSTMEEARPFYRKLIERHHEAMMAGEISTAMQIRDEANDLAIKLNGGTNLGICAPDGPAKVLESSVAAPDGTVPMWGQRGNYIVDVDGTRVRTEQDGIFGIGARMSAAPGFAAHAVDYDKPFISNTGYRSFLGYRPDIEAGITPDIFAREIIKSHISKELKGKLQKIERTYVERELERRAEKAAKTPQL